MHPRTKQTWFRNGLRKTISWSIGAACYHLKESISFAQGGFGSKMRTRWSSSHDQCRHTGRQRDKQTGSIKVKDIGEGRDNPDKKNHINSSKGDNYL